MGSPAIGYDGYPLGPTNGGTTTPPPKDPAQGFLDALANLSTYSGTTAANMAKGLVDQTKLNQTQDQLGLNRANTGVNVGNLGLAQNKFALSAPDALAKQSVKGDVLANGQDASVSGLPSYIHVGQVSGGLRPSMLSDSTRALGGQMSRNALADSTSGKYTTQAPLPSVPGATPMPDPSALQGLLSKTGIASGLASTGGGLLDALKKALSGGGGGASNTTSGASDPNSGKTPVTGGYFDPDGNWVTGTEPDLLTSDPGSYYGPDGGTATPTDPSGGTGTGPGMQEYLDWLAQQDGGGGTQTGTNWWDE